MGNFTLAHFQGFGPFATALSTPDTTTTGANTSHPIDMDLTLISRYLWDVAQVRLKLSIGFTVDYSGGAGQTGHFEFNLGGDILFDVVGRNFNESFSTTYLQVSPPEMTQFKLKDFPLVNSVPLLNYNSDTISGTMSGNSDNGLGITATGSMSFSGLSTASSSDGSMTINLLGFSGASAAPEGGPWFGVGGSNAPTTKGIYQDPGTNLYYPFIGALISSLDIFLYGHYTDDFGEDHTINLASTQPLAFNADFIPPPPTKFDDIGLTDMNSMFGQGKTLNFAFLSALQTYSMSDGYCEVEIEKYYQDL